MLSSAHSTIYIIAGIRVRTSISSSGKQSARAVLGGALAVGLMVLPGCGLWQQKAPTPPPDPVGLQLAQSATRIAEAWHHTNQVVTASEPPAARSIPAPPTHWPKGLDKLIDMRWVGPLYPAVQALARAAGWQASAMGLPLGTDVMLQLDGQNKTVGSFLRSAGIQAGDRATVVVTPENKSVHVLYREAEGDGGNTYD